MIKNTLIDLAIGAISGDLGRKLERVGRKLRPRPTGAQPSPRPIRIAFARVQQETNTLSPVLTTMEDFAKTHLLGGDALLGAIEPDVVEAEGFLRSAELTGFAEGARDEAALSGSEVELVPLCSAWAVPSGPLTRACFEEIAERVLTPLRRAHADRPVDAVFLSLHGAMGVQDLPLGVEDSPDSELVRRVREVVGDVPIGVTLDLHGNLCPGLVNRTQIIQAYRTNPHRDHVAVGARVGRVLVRTVRGEAHPVQAWRSLPMLLGGGTTLDFWPPMRAIFQHIRDLDKDPRVLAASVMMVHPWNDHKELGWSTLVTTDGQPELADRLADELAERAWEVRHSLPPRFKTAEEAIRLAREARLGRKLGVVVMADVSDVVTAGAPGDNTRLLSALLRDGSDLTAYVPLRDPALVDELWGKHQPGDVVTVVVGGKLDPKRGVPIELTAKIHGMPRAHGVERMVVLENGGVKLVVTEGPAFAIRPAFYETAGLSVMAADVVIVKNFFPFLMFFLPYSRKTLFVKTAGVTDFDAAYDLDFAGPIHPRDWVTEWRPTDQRRRKRASTKPAPAAATRSLAQE
jgi:microcystin degradation protein MlrC